jgi:hypothetical protein
MHGSSANICEVKELGLSDSNMLEEARVGEVLQSWDPGTEQGLEVDKRAR